ncbi:MAG: hypothetical protein ACI8RD_006493 [Bacillariaceae sp.]|jgi:hypothetical protein
MIEIERRRSSQRLQQQPELSSTRRSARNNVINSKRKRSRDETIVMIMTDDDEEDDKDSEVHYQRETSVDCYQHKQIVRKREIRTSTDVVLQPLTRSIGRRLFVLFWVCIVSWRDSDSSYVESFLFSGGTLTTMVNTNTAISTNSLNNYTPITSSSNIRYCHRQLPIMLMQQQSAAAADASSSSTSSSTSSSASSSSSSSAPIDLSQSFRSILAGNRNHHHRQRFVTGKFPLIVSVEENPTRKWLDLGRKQQQSGLIVQVNGTNIDRSLASYDRYQWLDDIERKELHDRYATVSMELLAEINIEKPGYLQILSSDGAGSLAALSRNAQQQQQNTADGGTIWNRWRKDNTQPNLDKQEEKSALRDRLWSTGFSLTSPRGFMKCVDIHDGYIHTLNPRSESTISWPNEITKVPTNIIQRCDDSPSSRNHVIQQHQHQQPFLGGDFSDEISVGSSYTQDALLVADGFLVPGKDRGGIYVVNNPGHEQLEWTISMTDPYSTDRWFYHKAIWVDLTGDGRQSILTARAKLRKVAASTTSNISDGSVSSSAYGPSDAMEQGRPKNGQLIWLEMPKPPHFDIETGTPLEEDGTTFNPFDARHLPWKERVLATGPDVTFAVADMDPNDDTIEVLASQFFDEKVTLHCIRRGPNPQVTFSRVIDDKPGASFGGILVDLDPAEKSKSHLVVDSGSTIKSLSKGNSFSHFLVTSHEANFKNNINKKNANNVMMSEYKGGNDKQQSEGQIRGGSLFAYKVPKGKNAWKTAPWIRTTIATGFQVKQQIWNVINPGAPGFAYAFHAHKDDESQGKRPMIAVAGDCAESAYIFRPQRSLVEGVELNNHEEKGDECDTLQSDPQAEYKLMCEIKCGATVGSIAVGYDDLCSAEQESGYAKVYVPCFEKDKILVFALGSGEEEDMVELDESGW